MERIMPEGAEPLLLFRTVAASPRAWTKFAAGSLLDKGPLPLREREIVIHRTAARCGCGYEWGVHAALFAARAGMDEDQLLATAADSIDSTLWSAAEAVLIETVDALIDRKRLGDEEFRGLSLHFATDQILEIVQLVAFYHGVALLCGTLDLAPEPGTPKLPS
jgi:alkylhydroperoxidase family enzyme